MPTEYKLKGITTKLAISQTSCLQVVVGVYKAILVHLLKAEVVIPPLDIYLNKRVADFEACLERTGLGALIRNTCSEVAVRLQQYRHYPLPSPLSLEFREGRAN